MPTAGKNPVAQVWSPGTPHRTGVSQPASRPRGSMPTPILIFPKSLVWFLSHLGGTKVLPGAVSKQGFSLDVFCYVFHGDAADVACQLPCPFTFTSESYMKPQHSQSIRIELGAKSLSYQSKSFLRLGRPPHPFPHPTATPKRMPPAPRRGSNRHPTRGSSGFNAQVHKAGLWGPRVPQKRRPLC